MEEIKQRNFSDIPVVWEPKEGSGRRMKDFMKRVQEKYNIQISYTKPHLGHVCAPLYNASQFRIGLDMWIEEDYWDIHKWSINNLDKFWAEIWTLSGMIYSKPFDEVIDLNVPMCEPQEWFAGARMNYAENLLKYRDDHVAIISIGEDKDAEKVTYAEMYEETRVYAAALLKFGVKKGDKVACFMSNRKEAVFAMLGATSIGAIWLGALPLMGSQAVLNRLKLVQPKILFTVDRFPHNNEETDMLPKLVSIAAGMPFLEKVVIVPSKPESEQKDISHIRNSCFLDEFLESGKEPDGSVPELVFEQVPFTHPVFISYTSGTTGLPKALIHGSGGLLAAYRDYWLHSSSNRFHCWLSMSAVGWASWNLMCTFLSQGLTMLLFEGVPYFLSPTYFWDMVDEFGISNVILTPSVLDELERRKYLPTERHHLNSLKLIVSGGSVVKPQNYSFFYQKIKKDVVFMSGYGSTEMIGSCVMMSDETLKIHQGETPVPCLGIDYDCVDESGKPVIGEVGELVLNKTTPALPLGMGEDKDRSIFKGAYFEKYPGKFTVGDRALVNPVTRGIAIWGRSDDTLKARGCRFGSAEIYNIVETFAEVHDSLCVSQYSKDLDERAVLFLKMRKGHEFSSGLVKKIQVSITKELSYRHVPEVIIEVKEIPYNMNGKKMEIIVKKIINHMPYNSDTIINPESLECFKNVNELRDF